MTKMTKTKKTADGALTHLTHEPSIDEVLRKMVRHDHKQHIRTHLLENTAIFIVQSKGGMGKTLVSSAAVQALYSTEYGAVLIEADVDPPDFFEIHKRFPYVNKLRIMSDIDIEEGLKLIQETNMPVVINTGAHSGQTEDIWMPLILDVLPALGKKPVILTPVDTNSDSLKNAKRLAELAGDAAITIRNRHFGNDKKVFRGFNDPFWEDREQRGLVIDMPVLPTTVEGPLRGKEPRSLVEIEVAGQLLHRAHAAHFRREFDLLRVLAR